MPSRLGSIPLVRRIEYLEVYLEGLVKRLSKSEMEASLMERKTGFEYEKNAALGRGAIQSKRNLQAPYLLRYCFRLSRDLGFISLRGKDAHISDKGVRFLQSGELERIVLFSEAYSEAYPHLYVLVDALSRAGGAFSLSVVKASFDSEAERLGLRMSQVVYDAVRDVATYLGLVNWFMSGTGSMRGQHVYLACRLLDEPQSLYDVRLWTGDKWLYCAESVVDGDVFRSELWESYRDLTGGVPGSPVIYSQIRDEVCSLLRIRDDQFDSRLMDMIEGDEVLRVYGSEGTLPYGRESAGMLKSLPPKNVWGDYIVFLRITGK